MIRDYTTFNKLSNIANSTFGTTGTGAMSRPIDHKMTANVIDENMIKVKYTCILNFPSKSLLSKVMPKHKMDALAMIDASLAKFVKEYKEQYDEDIKLKVLSETYVENVEHISSSVYAPQQRGFYRSHCLVKVTK